MENKFGRLLEGVRRSNKRKVLSLEESEALLGRRWMGLPLDITLPETAAQREARERAYENIMTPLRNIKGEN